MKLDNKKLVIFGWALLTLVTVTLLTLSWRAWGNVLVDFPEELYVPWQLSQGKLLYRDILHYYGPFSQYYHALLFHLFGINFTVIIISNIIVFLLMLGIWFRILTKMIPASVALFLLSCLVPIFFLGHHDWFGSFNYLAPYAHEASHGAVFISLQLALVLTIFTQSLSKKVVFYYQLLIGFCAGMILVLKPELTLPGIALLGFLFTDLKHRPSLRICAVIIVAMMTPLLFFTLYFHLYVEWSQALRYALGAFMPFIETNHAQHPFFREISGSSRIELLIAILPRYLLGWLLFIILHKFLGHYLSNKQSFLNQKKFRILIWLTFTLVFFQIPLIAIGSLLTLSTLLFLALVFIPKLKISSLDKKIFRIFSVFSLLMLLKIIFLPRLGWYGFTLAMPAFILFFVVHWSMIPSLFSKVDIYLWRASLLSFLAALSWQFTHLSWQNYREKSVAIGSGGDLLYAQEDTRISIPLSVINILLKDLKEKTSPQTSVLVLPETTILNYLARRENPTPYMSHFVMNTLFEHAGGSTAIIKTLNQNPPDIILYLRRSIKAFGDYQPIRGEQGFAEPVFKWIEDHYNIVGQSHNEHMDFEKLGFVVLKPKSQKNHQ